MSLLISHLTSDAAEPFSKRGRGESEIVTRPQGRLEHIHFHLSLSGWRKPETWPRLRTRRDRGCQTWRTITSSSGCTRTPSGSSVLMQDSKIRARLYLMGEPSPLDEEIESWKGFPWALRKDDLELWHAMVKEVRDDFREAVEKSGKTFTTDPFFMALLLAQQRMISRLRGELKRLGVETPDSSRGMQATLG